MKIKELVLSGYKRLMLNNIQTITYTPESMYQLILGTNGSGKSSLLNELSPLPAIQSNYVKGGFKKITIEYKKSIFVITSTFKSSAKHSVLKDGVEELNPGGTITVQKELIEQIFGITQDIHDLLIGRVNFTSMSPTKRREWLTSLCHVDFSYGISVFQKLKSRARDAQGALKHVKQRIGSETNKLLAIGDLEELESRYKSVHDELNFLFNEKDNGAKPTSQVEREFEECQRDIERMSEILVRKIPVMPDGFHYHDLSELNSSIEELKIEVSINESLKTRIGTEVSDLSEMLVNLNKAGVEDISSIENQIVLLRQERYVELRKLTDFRELTVNPINAQRAFYEVSDTVIGILNNLPNNSDRRFNKDSLEAAKTNLTDVNIDVEKCRNAIASYENKLEHLMSLKTEECPKCLHRWVPGKSDQDKTNLETIIKKGYGKLEHLTLRQKELSTFVDAASEYAELFGSLKRMVNNYPVLKDLWETITSSEDLLRDSKLLVNSVYSFGKALEIHCSVSDKTERIDYLESILNSTDVKEGVGVKSRIDALNDQLEQLTLDVSTLKEKMNVLVRHKQHVQKYLEYGEALENKINNLVELRDELIRSVRSTEIEGVITAHQNQLAILQTKRTEKNTLEGIIRDLEKSELELSEDNKLLIALANELSPVDGLIAEQLTGFIESFVAHLNQIIQGVWTYDLKILPCGLESGDLDYKFPLYVKHEGTDNRPPDISDGSEAQVEIINFAFRLVTMVYLNLEEYPLYLDEIGRSFDEQHRINVMSFIKRLVDAGNYTQLFLISHYAAQFGSFVQAEILVLDSTNISIPQKHNDHVIFG